MKVIPKLASAIVLVSSSISLESVRHHTFNPLHQRLLNHFDGLVRKAAGDLDDNYAIVFRPSYLSYLEDTLSDQKYSSKS